MPGVNSHLICATLLIPYIMDRCDLLGFSVKHNKIIKAFVEHFSLYAEHKCSVEHSLGNASVAQPIFIIIWKFLSQSISILFYSLKYH